MARPASAGWWSDSWAWRGFSQYELSTHEFEDFFFIDDSQYYAYPMGSTLWLLMTNENAHEELSAADLTLPNPIARPDIHVSRINPRHIALEPKAGLGMLDSSGEPQAVSGSLPGTWTRWERNPDLERALLIDFDRNHGFRVGADGMRFRAAAATYPSTSSRSPTSRPTRTRPTPASAHRSSRPRTRPCSSTCSGSSSRPPSGP